MKVFEEEYKEGLTIEEAIPMGIKGLHAATEGKFDVNNVEIGFIKNDGATFERMSREDIKGYVDKLDFEETPGTEE